MRRQDGFTLLEMLVVLIVLSILATMAYAFHQAGRQRAGDAAARVNIRVAMPALEAYRLDNNGSYAGATLAGLRAAYSPGVNVVIHSADATTYCVSSTVENRTWYKHGPQGAITQTSCA